MAKIEALFDQVTDLVSNRQEDVFTVKDPLRDTLRLITISAKVYDQSFDSSENFFSGPYWSVVEFPIPLGGTFHDPVRVSYLAKFSHQREFYRYFLETGLDPDVADAFESRIMGTRMFAHSFLTSTQPFAEVRPDQIPFGLLLSDDPGVRIKQLTEPPKLGVFPASVDVVARQANAIRYTQRKGLERLQREIPTWKPVSLR
ncbi:hypothetical protein HY025_03745 [Candidatus Daviesbacteria bacterium]|nr:hypothetical protein [Candidatus Daviesbacteria bacterium]